MAAGGNKTGKGKGLSGQALKQFRSDVAALKKKGIISAKVDARKQRDTKYMRAKVRKYQDVLKGTAIAVPAPKEVRQKYVEKGVLEARGKMLIAPREFANQRARLKRGLVEVSRPLKNGTEEYVILPFRPVDMPDLIRKLRDDPTLDGLKRADEFFAFRLFGYNSVDAFPDMEDLADHVERNYQHLFNGKASSDAVRHITFQRFKGAYTGHGNPTPSREPKIETYMPRSNSTGRNSERVGSYEIEKKKRLALRKAKTRAKETPEERAARLKANAIRTAQYKQRKRDEK